ncbi:hypothetical protein SH449x_000166 [Pirellulaceae bacterium SH449]
MEIGNRRFVHGFHERIFMVNPVLEIPHLFKLFCEQVKRDESDAARESASKLREMLQALPEHFDLEEFPEDKHLSVLMLHTPQAQKMLAEFIAKLESTLK